MTKFLFHNFGQVTVILPSVGKSLGFKKLLAQVTVSDSISRDQELAGVPQLINRLQRLKFLFLSATCFSDLKGKKNMQDKNNDTNSFK